MASNIRCWLTDDDSTDDDRPRIEQARREVVKSVNVRAIPPQRRLVVRRKEVDGDEVFALYLEIKETDENGVARWRRKRCIASGEPENPLL